MYLLLWLIFCIEYGTAYRIYNVNDSDVCNKTIYLEQGSDSAAILKMTSRDNYSFTPLHCTISFKAPIHNWSGLTGILEYVDLRRFQDTAHHMGQSVCVDHITVLTEKSDSIPNERQCGKWSVTPGKPLSRLGYSKALVGYCPNSNIQTNAEKCHVSELKVVVSVGREVNDMLWRNVTWPPHKGFTFVVTAYNYPIKNGESECRDGLRLCSESDTPGINLGVFHCVHNSLWCDGHVNCGLLENMDEISCFKGGMWDGLITVVIGPWMGASLFMLVAFLSVVYWRYSKIKLTREQQSTNQEINSYAESYELSSNLSLAHHMAIQVRVVCNPNHPHHGARGLQPWKNDHPPSYETLFPQGPPQTHSPLTGIITVAHGSSRNSTDELGVNFSSPILAPPSSNATSLNNHQYRPLSIQSSSNALPDFARPPPDITSVIDLNVTRNNQQATSSQRPSDVSSISSDTNISESNAQVSVQLTATPSHPRNENDQCSTVHSNTLQSSTISMDHQSNLIQSNTPEAGTSLVNDQSSVSEPIILQESVVLESGENIVPQPSGPQACSSSRDVQNSFTKSNTSQENSNDGELFVLLKDEFPCNDASKSQEENIPFIIIEPSPSNLADECSSIAES